MCGISAVCEQFGLTPRAVRFYEDRGLVTSGRDRFNCRRYDKAAFARLEKIAAYRQAGLSLEDISEIFALEAEGGVAPRDFATQKLRAKILELEGARRQAEQLLQRFAAEHIVAVKTERSDALQLVAGGRR